VTPAVTPVALSESKTARLTSLDAFRGLTIAAMILVNNPGSWSAIYRPLAHAEWHGCTPTDLIFPFFLFIVGTAMAFSLGKHGRGSHVWWRIGRRVLVLFALGLVLNGFWSYDPATTRVPGVLQRIALVYGLACVLVLTARVRTQVAVGAALLLGYWALLALVPPPGGVAPSLSAESNWVRSIDRAILPAGNLYRAEATDPEGLLSTLPAMVTCLLGYWAGLWIRRGPRHTRTAAWLAVVGACGVALGWLWALGFPLNKKLWTSSYVLFTAGWAAVGLAGMLWVIDVRGWSKWSRPLVWMGVNAIFVFVASGLVGRLLVKIRTGEPAVSVKQWLYERAFLSWSEGANASLAFAAATLAAWWLVLWGMERLGWRVRV
jgi:Uncharacterized conserved protein